MPVQWAAVRLAEQWINTASMELGQVQERKKIDNKKDIKDINYQYSTHLE